MRIAVGAGPRDAASWVGLARRVEDAGHDALYVADHPGTAAAPFVALAGAAAVTGRIQLGTCVVNAGAWEPMALASEVATLDLVSGGRALLGIGAGHTPVEWTAAGRPYPSAGERVDRLVELTEATVALLAGGPVTFGGGDVTLVDAELAESQPVQDPVPLLVGITGLGRTLADGHRHAVDWSAASLERTLGWIRDAAGDRSPTIEAMVQVVELTDDAEAAAAAIAAKIEGVSAADLLDTPYAWIGTAAEIRSRLARFETDLGIGAYAVRAAHLDAVDEVLAPLTD